MGRPGSDGEIVVLSLDDPLHFAEIFDRHYLAVHHFVARRISRSLADEIAAEAFRIAFEKRASADPGVTNLRPWIIGIANNEIRHHRRAEEARLSAYAKLPRAPSGDETDAALNRIAADGLRPQLIEGLVALSVADRDVLLLYAWADLTYAEIAAALEVPLGTVQSRLARARVALREALEGAENDEPGVSGEGELSYG